MSVESYIALTRFGMGARASEPAAVSDPMGWLWRQLGGSAGSVYFNGLPSTGDMLADMAEVQKTKDKELIKKKRRELRQYYVADVKARVLHGATTETPFLERLVLFWSNHFTVSVGKSYLAGIVGPYEREAIRPYVTGRFVDMLVAVAKHPAMLAYLDNVQSTGPDSVFGMKKDKGLNENLAREILELHTLGVNGGYTQQDVTSFAKVITGWSVEPRSKGFVFRPQLHEPGAQTIMGMRYAQQGEAQGMAVLEAIARHPATARHIATKLVRHFISDDPPQAAVEAVAQSFLSSGGELKAVYRTLLERPEAWQVSTAKVRDGYDLVIAALRLCGIPQDDERPARKMARNNWAFQSLQFLGRVPFTAQSPAGFKDTLADVAGPEAMLRRAEWGQTASRVLPLPADVPRAAEIAMGPVMGQLTRQVIAGTHDPRTQLAFLLASPEFQRR